MPVEVTQPGVEETQSQAVESTEEFGIFASDKPAPQQVAEAAPAPAAVVETPKEDSRYEEASKLTASMLELKKQNEELRQLISSQKDETTDELAIVRELFAEDDARSPAEQRVDDLKAELAEFKRQQQIMLEDVRLAQQGAWASTELEKIQATSKSLAAELPWVDVVNRVNPGYHNLVLQRRAEAHQAGQNIPYEQIIRQSNDNIRDEFTTMLDNVLAVPGAKQLVLEKLGIPAVNRPATAVPKSPSPTLDGSLSVSDPTVSSFTSDDEAFEAAVALMAKGGYKED